MKKYLLIIVGASLLASMLLCILEFTFVNAYSTLTVMPYGLKKGYQVLKVFSPYGEPKVSVENNKAGLLALLDKEDVIIIDNIDSLCLELYDPSGYFQRYPLAKGNYIFPEIKDDNLPCIFVQEGSYAYEFSQKHNGLFTLWEKPMQVIGVYSDEHPWANYKHPLVQAFGSSASLKGDYYINASYATIKNIHTYLANLGYECSLQIPSESSISETLVYLIFGARRPLFIYGTLFAYFSFFLLLRLIFYLIQGEARVHLLFGAKRNELRYRMLRPALIRIFAGSFVGSILAGVFFSLANPVTTGLFLLLVILGMASSFLIQAGLCFVAFSGQRYSIHPTGVTGG